jgi:hypothetical protein
MRLKSRSHTLHPYMPLLPWKYASTYFPSRPTPKLFYSYTGSEHQNMFPIHFNPCYSIKLQIFLLLPPINISKKRLGCSERKKKKRKRTNVLIKKLLSEHPRFSSKSSSSKERYVFLQGAKVELGFHHCHHISPFVTTSTYLCIHHIHTPTIFHHTSTTYIGPHTCTS